MYNVYMVIKKDNLIKCFMVIRLRRFGRNFDQKLSFSEIKEVCFARIKS